FNEESLGKICQFILEKNISLSSQNHSNATTQIKNSAVGTGLKAMKFQQNKPIFTPRITAL
ncbi:hypothetical protein, partial [Pseudoalteromonas nigrifaciens]|uniref:hypothetical protein n=1 Tax=Pseudoalteromonas nigrifaciens TaxID=28109 RepID=UPI003561F202